jgi:membrane-associated phospholipid phosphatase
MISRGLELGENRILAGMYSPLDVIGGRMLAEAVVAANLVDSANASLKLVKFQQAHATFYKLTHRWRRRFRLSPMPARQPLQPHDVLSALRDRCTSGLREPQVH